MLRLWMAQHARAALLAGVKTVKNPISLARLVMTQTPHVLLIGHGAEEFADAQKVERADASYFRTEAQMNSWKKWKARQDEAKTSMITSPDDPLFYLGTVGCVVLDSDGNLAAATSTGGTLAKRWGRVGDSPIVGAGTIADNRSWRYLVHWYRRIPLFATPSHTTFRAACCMANKHWLLPPKPPCTKSYRLIRAD